MARDQEDLQNLTELGTVAKHVVVRIWRDVVLPANHYEHRLLPQQVDSSADEVSPNTEPAQHFLIFRKDPFRNESGKRPIL